VSLTVRASGLTKTYQDGLRRVEVLRGADLAVEPGELVAVVGPSGSGKSTLLHLLGALDRPDGGEIEIGGQRLAGLSGARLAAFRNRTIGFVFQFHQLLPDFTAVENVAFAAHLAGDPELAPEGLLELVGLSAKADNLPAELSGGEAQRVAIARALAQQPELLLCDEPTGHLDSDTSERVLDLIEALQRELGFALVVATHDPDVAARLERSVELEDGAIVREETG